ncbi:MAG: hypothetical protein L0027_07840, partial [Candidatus Rokubacteria bacterium]|nr:hypothetical protein [Candidatus Rokubacteria bacterium]
MRLARAFLVVLLLAGPVAAGGGLALPTADELSRDVVALTAPDMEGRGSATPGGDRAAAYLAGRVAALGLDPGGDGGTFLQWFVVAPGARPAAASALSPVGAAPLALERDWLPHGGSLTGEVTGEIVLVG